MRECSLFGDELALGSGMISEREAIAAVEGRPKGLAPLPEGESWEVFADQALGRSFGWVAKSAQR